MVWPVNFLLLTQFGMSTFIGEGTIADAILDRLTYSSHRVELEGESFRKHKKLKG